MKQTTVVTDFENYLLSCIDSENYDINGLPLDTNEEKLQFLAECFKSEYCHEYNMKYYKGNKIKMFASWISGLPSSFNIAFENYEILNLGVLFDLIHANASEETEDVFLQNWFDMVAKTTFELSRKNGIQL